MLEFLLLSLTGVLIGVLTGLIPGIHPNTVVFVSLPLYLGSEVSLTVYISLITSMAVSHSFHDFLPSILMGVPEAESAMASIPGGRMASNGEGLRAFYATLRGGLISVTLLMILLPIFYISLGDVYGFLEEMMFYILLFLLFFLVMFADSRKDSLTITVLSGLLGITSFSSPVNQNYVLLPVFAGLFAIPSILIGLRNRYELPEQESSTLKFEGSVSSYFGTAGGILAGVLPGMGAATATTFLTPIIDSEEDFLVSMGAINTSDAIFSFVSLLLVGKARSGSAVALNQVARIDPVSMNFALGISLFSVSISGILAYKIGEKAFRLANVLRLDRVLLGSLLAIIVSISIFTGPLGVLIMMTSSAIGYAAVIKDLRRCCMAVLMVPALQFYAVNLIP